MAGGLLQLVLLKVLTQSLDFGCLQKADHLEMLPHEVFAAGQFRNHGSV